LRGREELLKLALSPPHGVTPDRTKVGELGVLVFRTPPPRQKFVVRIDMLNIRVDLSTLAAFPAARDVRIETANGISIPANTINT
jgi:hypothetical protein